jgi:hypothetical protein
MKLVGIDEHFHEIPFDAGAVTGGTRAIPSPGGVEELLVDVVQFFFYGAFGTVGAHHLPSPIAHDDLVTFRNRAADQIHRQDCLGTKKRHAHLDTPLA